MNFIRGVRLYFKFVVQYIKILMQSKMDFLMGIFSFLINQFLGIVFIALIFRQVPSLNGWSFKEVLFVYGFSQIPKGIDHMCTDNLWSLAWYQIRIGWFDKYLLRPANVLLQVVAETVQFDGLGEIILGIIIIFKASGVTAGFFTGKVGYMLLSIFAGVLVFSAIKIICTAVSFWTKESGDLLQMVNQMADFSKYPATIYPGPLRKIITYVIPFALVAYYPACYILDKGYGCEVVWFELIVSIVLFIVSIGFFYLGVSKYESVGN